jgi:hypothetical protein
MLSLLALFALVCATWLAGPVGLRLEAWWHIGHLDSHDEKAFEKAFQALARDMDADVVYLLCDELEANPSRAVYYQIVRILYARCNVPFAPENVALPTAAEVRRMVEQKFPR